MFNWIFSTVRKASVFVRVHMETFRLFKFRKVRKCNLGQLSKNFTNGQTKYLRPNQTVKFSH